MVEPVDLDEAREARVIERREDYLSPAELQFIEDEEAAEAEACLYCHGTGKRPLD